MHTPFKQSDESGSLNLPVFLASNNLKPFISKDFAVPQIQYRLAAKPVVEPVPQPVSDLTKSRDQIGKLVGVSGRAAVVRFRCWSGPKCFD